MPELPEPQRESDDVAPEMLIQEKIKLVLSKLFEQQLEEEYQVNPLSSKSRLQFRYNDKVYLARHKLIENLEKSTQGKCDVGAILTLALLQREHPDLFRRYLMVTSEAEGNEKFTKDPTWRYHSVGIVQTNQGDWIGFSVGNWRVDMNPSLNDPLLVADTLPELLAMVADTYGGQWLTGNADWQQSLSNIPTGEMRFWNITKGGQPKELNMSQDLVDQRLESVFPIQNKQKLVGRLIQFLRPNRK